VGVLNPFLFKVSQILDVKTEEEEYLYRKENKL